MCKHTDSAATANEWLKYIVMDTLPTDVFGKADELKGKVSFLLFLERHLSWIEWKYKETLADCDVFKSAHQMEFLNVIFVFLYSNDAIKVI